MNALVIDGPALAAEQYMDALVAIADPCVGNVLDALGQRRIVNLAYRFVDQTRSGLSHHRTGTALADAVGPFEEADERVALHRLQSFFWITS